MIKTTLAALLFAAASCASAAGLSLGSERVLVVDRDTGKTLYSKAADAPAPIASVTKLMTAMVLLDEKPNLDEILTVTDADVDTLKNSRSRLPVGTRLTRREMLHLALMSSENRAAHALARTSRLGLKEFISEMNFKAQSLQMVGAFFVDPTGLSPRNRASATDLGRLVESASGYSAITNFTTRTSGKIDVGGSPMQYRNTNPVVGREGWDVLLSKTGFISEAGRCVVVGFKAAGRNLAVVLLGAGSSAERERDLTKVRNWVAGTPEPQARLKARKTAVLFVKKHRGKKVGRR